MDCLPLVLFDNFYDNNGKTWLQDELTKDNKEKLKQYFKNYNKASNKVNTPLNKYRKAIATQKDTPSEYFRNGVTSISKNSTFILSKGTYNVCGGDAEWKALVDYTNGINNTINVLVLFEKLYNDLDTNGKFCKAFSTDLCEKYPLFTIRTFGSDFEPITEKIKELLPSTKIYTIDTEKTVNGKPKTRSDLEQYDILDRIDPNNICIFRDDYNKWNKSDKVNGKIIFVKSIDEKICFFDDNITDPITDIVLVNDGPGGPIFDHLWPKSKGDGNAILGNIRKQGWVKPLNDYDIYLIKPLLSSIFDRNSFISILDKIKDGLLQSSSGGKRAKRTNKAKKTKKANKTKKAKRTKRAKRTKKFD